MGESQKERVKSKYWHSLKMGLRYFKNERRKYVLQTKIETPLYPPDVFSRSPPPPKRTCFQIQIYEFGCVLGKVTALKIPQQVVILKMLKKNYKRKLTRTG
jgi:uncharacterized membrane protein